MDVALPVRLRNSQQSFESFVLFGIRRCQALCQFCQFCCKGTRVRLDGKRGVRSAECGVRSAECGVRSAECGVWKCGVWKMRSVGMRSMRTPPPPPPPRVRKAFIKGEALRLLRTNSSKTLSEENMGF